MAAISRGHGRCVAHGRQDGGASAQVGHPMSFMGAIHHPVRCRVVRLISQVIGSPEAGDAPS